MEKPVPVSSRAANIEYAIRDVVVPAVQLEAEGHEIIKLNIGDPIAYPGLPTLDMEKSVTSRVERALTLAGKLDKQESRTLPGERVEDYVSARDQCFISDE